MEAEQPVASSSTEQWEQKLSQLRAENEQLQRRRADAEKDRDLFRDLYGKASAHASEVTRENNDLQERASLAEGQARDGIALIKATYTERVRLLEQDVERWKSQCHVLTERDARTDDELRRRAALEPELRAENEHLRGQLYALEEDYRRMEAVVEQITKQHVDETAILQSAANVPIVLSTTTA